MQSLLTTMYTSLRTDLNAGTCRTHFKFLSFARYSLTVAKGLLASNSSSLSFEIRNGDNVPDTDPDADIGLNTLAVVLTTLW
jgi:hypothetical protein